VRPCRGAMPASRPGKSPGRTMSATARFLGLHRTMKIPFSLSKDFLAVP
jgi:hypothetical protein